MLPNSEQRRWKTAGIWGGERPAMREKREEVSEDKPPDWGDGDSPLGCPASTDDDDGDDDAQFSQWPWGPGLIGQRWRRCTASRKAQRARGGATTSTTQKTRVNTAAEKPRELEGEPPRRGLPQDRGEGRATVSLAPSLEWQVRQVQAHMASKRGSATSSRPDVK